MQMKNLWRFLRRSAKQAKLTESAGNSAGASKPLSDREQQHAAWVLTLEEQVANNQMTPAQRDDLLEQKALFDAALEANRKEHPDKWVGYVAGEKLVAPSWASLSKMQKERYPNRMLYFESTADQVLFEEF